MSLPPAESLARSVFPQFTLVEEFNHQAHFSASSSQRRVIMSAPLSKELRKQYQVKYPNYAIWSVMNLSSFICLDVTNFRSALSLYVRTTKFWSLVATLKVVKDESPLSIARNGSCMSNVWQKKKWTAQAFPSESLPAIYRWSSWNWTTTGRIFLRGEPWRIRLRRNSRSRVLQKWSVLG